MSKPGVKGGPRVPGSGRQKGTPNKRTQELLELWEQFGYDPAKALNVLLPELPPEVQANVHLKLMEYKYPKRKAIEHTGSNDEPLMSDVVAFEDKFKFMATLVESRKK